MNILNPTKQQFRSIGKHSELKPQQIAARLAEAGLDAHIEGDPTIIANHPANLDLADAGSITFYSGDDSNRIKKLKDLILICRTPFENIDKSVTQVITPRPRLAFAITLQFFAPPPPKPGIHPTAIIDDKAEIDPSVYVGPFCVLEECRIGPRTILYSHVSIFSKTCIGSDTIIEPHACIGQFGHGFEWGPDGQQYVMPQLGGTYIGNNCYVGASSVISRGAIQDTILEDWVRVAENSLIGHNSHLMEGAFVANGVSMAGMTTIGKRCWLGTGSSFCNQPTLGNHITVGAGAVVNKDFLEDGLVLVGVPAKIIKQKVKGDNTRVDMSYDD